MEASASVLLSKSPVPSSMAFVQTPFRPPSWGGGAGDVPHHPLFASGRGSSRTSQPFLHVMEGLAAVPLNPFYTSWSSTRTSQPFLHVIEGLAAAPLNPFLTSLRGSSSTSQPFLHVMEGEAAAPLNPFFTLWRGSSRSLSVRSPQNLIKSILLVEL